MTWVCVVGPRAAFASMVQGHCDEDTLVFRAGDPGPPHHPPLVVLVDCLSQGMAESLDLCDRARRDWPGVPVAVVAPLSRDMARALAKTDSIEVVWEDELDRVGPLIGRVAADGLRRTVAEILRRPAGRDEVVENAVRVALLDRVGSRPSVHVLARQLLMSESALRERWRKTDLPWTPRSLIGWSVVCAVAEGREMGRSLEVIARAMGISDSTVHRTVRRLLGCTPTEVTKERVIIGAEMWAGMGDS